MTRLNEESKYYNKLAQAASRRRQFAGQFEPVHDVIPGIVYAISGSIYVPTRGENYVHVHEFGVYASNAYAYKPPGILVWEGAGVLMKRSPKPPHELEIIGTHVSPYPRTVVTETQINRTAVSIHGINHQWPTEATKGPDPFSIWPPALAMLKAVTDESNLKVTVGPLAYLRGTTRQWFPTELVDLTSYLPASGKVLCALLSLNVDTGTIDVTTGATFDDPYGTFTPLKPETPSGNIPSGYFYLRGGATTLSIIDDYLDARLWLAGSAGSVSRDELGILESEFDFPLTEHIVNHPVPDPAPTFDPTHHFLYNFSTSITSPPNTGEIRLDTTPTQPNSKQMFIHDTDRNGKENWLLWDYLKPGDIAILRSEENFDDYLVFEVRAWDWGTDCVEIEIFDLDYSGFTPFSNGEALTLTLIWDGTTFASRDRRFITLHVDGTWYWLLRFWLGAEQDRTWALDFLISGHSDDAATASWAYQMYAWARNDGGTCTGGFTLNPLTEYDSNYDVRAVINFNSLEIQVRRSGGTDYDIEWSASGREAVY